MKKQVLTAVALLSLLVTLAMSSFANSGRILVDIPFAFTAGKVALPAGKYVVEQTSSMGGVLLIRDTQSKDQAFVTVMSGDTGKMAPSKATLVFHRYGDTYFLSQIWEQGSTIVNEIPKSSAERDLIKKRRNHLAQNATAPEIVTVMAQ